MIALACTLTMCNKEATTDDLPAQGVSEEVQNILDFVDRTSTSGRQKQLVFHTQEEALFLLEAALNYGAIDPEAKAGDLKFEEFSKQVPFTNDKVSDQDLADAYNDLRQQFADAALEEGHKMLVADVEAKVVDGALVFRTTRVSGQEPQALGGAPVQTGYTYNYRNRTHPSVSTCNPTTFASDKAIQGRINSAIGVQTVDYILTNVQTWHVNGCTDLGFAASPDVAFDPVNRIIPATYFPNPNDPDGQDPWAMNAYNDYRTYLRIMSVMASNQSDSEPTCLTPAAMSYLTQNAWDLMFEVKSTYATNNSNSLVPVSCYIQGHRVWGPHVNGNNYRWSFAHNVSYIYGRWQYVGGTRN